MKRRILTLGIALALVATMVVPMAALAGNEASQNASTSTDALQIVSKYTDDDVTTIIFPWSSAGAKVSNPFSLDDLVPPAQPPAIWQVLSDTASEPVVRLKNTSGVDLMVWLQVDAWTNGVVTEEYYKLVDTGTTNVTEVNDVLSPDGGFYIVGPIVIMGPGAYKDLYLAVDLIATPGVSGSSTLTVLGTAP
jgi:hypothetical protein